MQDLVSFTTIPSSFVHLSRVGYRTPSAWWGPVWATPCHWTLRDLVQRDILSPVVAAALWEWVARRRSLVVVAGPRGAGKSTLLTALLAALPPAVHRIYIQGCYEAFGFQTDPACPPASTMLLINEISAHLPAYLWGPAVARILALGGELAPPAGEGADRERRDGGYALAATMHATTAAEVVAALAGYPLRVPPPVIANLGLVIALAPAPGTVPAAATNQGQDQVPNPVTINPVVSLTRLQSGPRQGVVLTPAWDRAADSPRASATAQLAAALDLPAAAVAATARWLTAWRDRPGPLTGDQLAAILAGPGA